MNPPDTQTEPTTRGQLSLAAKPAAKTSALPGAKEAAKIRIPEDDAFLQDYILDEKLQKLAAGKSDFVIWLGADNCRQRQDLNFAALMYHELRHIDKDDKDQAVTQGHEFEGFASEVERFGIWRPSMKPIAKAFQESLFPEEVATQ